MVFDEKYFEGETRDDFYIEPLMKRCWAAQMEVLEDIRTLCEKHDIHFYAEWGSLLGAVRHQGFIPWDDDLDIGMLRSDYNRFLEVADELPDNYSILNIHKDDNQDVDDMLSRVLNTTYIRIDEAFLKKYHGCPFALGIDIFPSDYISRDKEERQVQLSMLHIVYSMALNWQDNDGEFTEKLHLIHEIERMCQYTFSKDKPMKRQLFELAELLCQLNDDTNSDEIGMPILMIDAPENAMPKEAFLDIHEVPFETTTIPVIGKSKEYCAFKYGDYMTPVKEWDTHTYPFFKDQKEILKNYLQENHLEFPVPGVEL